MSLLRQSVGFRRHVAAGGGFGGGKTAAKIRHLGLGPALLLDVVRSLADSAAVVAEPKGGRPHSRPGEARGDVVALEQVDVGRVGHDVVHHRHPVFRRIARLAYRRNEVGVLQRGDGRIGHRASDEGFRPIGPGVVHRAGDRCRVGERRGDRHGPPHVARVGGRVLDQAIGQIYRPGRRQGRGRRGLSGWRRPRARQAGRNGNADRGADYGEHSQRAREGEQSHAGRVSVLGRGCSRFAQRGGLIVTRDSRRIVNRTASTPIPRWRYVARPRR